MPGAGPGTSESCRRVARGPRSNLPTCASIIRFWRRADWRGPCRRSPAGSTSWMARGRRRSDEWAGTALGCARTISHPLCKTCRKGAAIRAAWGGTIHWRFAVAKKFVALMERFWLTARRAHRKIKEVLGFSSLLSRSGISGIPCIMRWTWPRICSCWLPFCHALFLTLRGGALRQSPVACFTLAPSVHGVRCSRHWRLLSPPIAT